MKKKSVMSKPARLFCVLFMLVMLGSMVGMVASAYQYSYGTTGMLADGEYTPVHRKYTDSSIRVHNASSRGLDVHIYGCNSTGGSSQYCNASSDIYVEAWETRTMTNWVNERGYSYARLRLYEYSGQTVSVNVYWDLDI